MLDNEVVCVTVVEDDVKLVLVKLVLVSVIEVVVLVEVELAVEVEDVVDLTRIHMDRIESDTEWQRKLCKHC